MTTRAKKHGRRSHREPKLTAEEKRLVKVIFAAWRRDPEATVEKMIELVMRALPMPEKKSLI
jgi:hypothetical protein